MALLRLHEIRDMKPEERKDKMKELRDELMRERGVAAMGGAPPSPGKIKSLRTGIARLATVMREEGEI
ncbi:MAG: 50S ribosomal protein L29 [Thermoplasmatota archaeon]